MAVRPTMATIIGRVRRLIADREPGSQVFSDQDVQDALDVHRTHSRYLILRPEGTRPPDGGLILYLDYYADGCGQWEDGAQLVDGSFNVLDPLLYAADLLTGHWQFAETANWPLYVTGYAYDVYGAAADILEEWAGIVKLKYDFQRGDQKLSRSQMMAALLELAASYRAKQMPMIATQVRSDVHGTDELGVIGFSGPWN